MPKTITLKLEDMPDDVWKIVQRDTEEFIKKELGIDAFPKEENIAINMRRFIEVYPNEAAELVAHISTAFIFQIADKELND